MSENELQAKLSLQLGQALSGLKSLAGEVRTVKAQLAELSQNTNKLQQESARTTKTQTDGAQAAGKAAKTYNELVAEQAKKLQDARIKAAALADAQRMLGYNAPKRILAPTVEEFQAIDRAKAAAMGFGRAQQQVSTTAASGLEMIRGRYLGIAAAAGIALKVAGDMAQRYRELEDRGVKNLRSSGAAALSIEGAMQASGASDVAGLTEEALKLKGPFNQESITAFVNQVVQRNPDVDDQGWRTLFRAFEATALTPGAGQTLANLSRLAPGANADQLSRMTREYTRGSGGRALDESATKEVQGLIQTGFFSPSEAMALVSGLASQERTSEAGALAEKLRPPKATGNQMEDEIAQSSWWNSVGYLRGQHSAGRRAIDALAPGLASDLRDTPLGRRVSRTEYALTSAVDRDTFNPRGSRAAAEVFERERDRAVEMSTVMDEAGMARAQGASGRAAAIEWRKNKAAAGDPGALAAEMVDAAQGAIPFNFEQVTRREVNRFTAPPVPVPDNPRVLQALEGIERNTRLRAKE